LRELWLSEESRTSDFFELFPDTLTTGPLDDADLDGFIAPLPEQGVDVDTPARKELVNWTGGIPILVAAFLHELYSAAASGATVGRDLVNEIGETFEQRYPDILPVIWNDASELQLVLGQLTEGEVAAGDIPAPDRECLCSMGLAIESGNKVKSVCRLMERCSRKRAPRAQHLMQLFGGQEGYDANIRGVLELRLAHIQGMDATLHGYIKGAVRNLIPDPSHALLMVRSIAETALRMVWQSELDDGQLLPQAWIDEWRGIDGGTAKRVCEQADRGDRRLPISPGRQCGLLNLATGSSNDIRRVTRYVTRATYMLLDHVQSAGDYGVHQTERADTALAASICLSAIELGGRLTKELP